MKAHRQARRGDAFCFLFAAPLRAKARPGRFCHWEEAAIAKGGAVFVNEHFELTDLREKPQPGEPTSPWYNAGIYVFRPSIFEFTAKLKPSPRGEYELTDAIRELAQSGKRVQAIELTGEWADVRDPEILAKLNKL